MTKQELRKKFLQERLRLSPVELDAYSHQLCDSFFSSIDLQAINVLHIFLPIKIKNEPNTWLIIERLKTDFPTIEICVPRIGLTNNLESYYLKSADELEENKWAIPEPRRGNMAQPEKIDLVIVPLLVVDKQGNRVGYGKGYYDSFLRRCRDDCKKIGLSFFEPVEKIEDIDAFDCPLNSCVTPVQTFLF
jgi:5-formyltetrahydrofolate cyclo-ligase